MKDNTQAERYRQEMMQLYGKRRTEPETKEEKPSETAAPFPVTGEEIFKVDEDAPDDTAWHPHPENDREDSPDDPDEYSSRYPEPDLSELGENNQDDTPPEYATEESLGDSVGYIQVYTRTGDSSQAVEGASVMVTAIVEGTRLILASVVTDSSGAAPQISVPVPSSELSQSPGSEVRPYSLYDISVTAPGYFNARSVDVPVFEGIISVQNFSMIPVPSMMNSSDETVTYFNQEPF